MVKIVEMEATKSSRREVLARTAPKWQRRRQGRREGKEREPREGEEKRLVSCRRERHSQGLRVEGVAEERDGDRQSLLCRESTASKKARNGEREPTYGVRISSTGRGKVSGTEREAGKGVENAWVSSLDLSLSSPHPQPARLDTHMALSVAHVADLGAVVVVRGAMGVAGAMGSGEVSSSENARGGHEERGAHGRCPKDCVLWMLWAIRGSDWCGEAQGKRR